MNSSDKHFIESFEANFGAFKNKGVPIALYGIGQKTQLIIENVKGLNILGLMDKDTVGKTVYGLSVLSFEEVINKVKVIIIAANMAVADVIYQRISFLKEHGIKFFRIDGSEPATLDEELKKNPYFNNNRNGLNTQIDTHDVISFDLFDTLIMRRVLSPSDIFDLAEAELDSTYGSSFDFKVKRIEAEVYCYNEIDRNFDIYNVYNRLKEQLNVTSDVADKILEIELSLEIKNCLPRNEIVSAMMYAKQKEKLVCITTDTYLKERHILSLLNSIGIAAYDALHISCETGKSKADGSMWQYLGELYEHKKVLHIGDNEVSDIKNAQQAGIDAFELKSALELINISSLNNLRKYLDTLENRLMLGQLSAHLLNNPFAFNTTGGVLKINTMYDLGYLSFGPLVLNFLLWLIRSSKQHHIDKLFFFSRDGYLLQKLYQQVIAALGLEAPEGIYFLTSRRAASVAAIYDEEDVAFIINWMCNVKKTTVKQILRVAFDVYPHNNDHILNRSLFELSKEEITQYIVSNYLQQILKSAKRERVNYLKYMRSVGLSRDDKVGCVNYVGRGVTQRCVSRIIGKELHGYYFATESDMREIMPSLDTIYAVYGNLTHPYMENSSFISKYLFGEVILSSPDEQVTKFDDSGKAVFQNRTSERDFASIEECHHGIAVYIDDMMNTDSKLLERSFSTDLIVSLYNIFSSGNCQISENVKKSFTFNDYYDPAQTDVCIL